MKKEIIFNHFTKSQSIQYTLIAILGIILISGLYFVVSNKYKNKKKLRNIGLLASLTSLVLFGLDFLIMIITLGQPSITDPKYYEMKNIPVSEFSLKDDQFKTKDGKIIDGTKDEVLTMKENTSLNVKKTKVKLKQYQLKKEWYDMINVPKQIYYVEIIKPATDVNKNN
ncbi:MAG: hypothetical protein HDS11_04015 [Bacteroides sp.]|nr:hypothetical protein [Bacteroides sp.]